jgi:universal stress protein E
MPLPKRILVVVDPTADAQPAVQRAALIAPKTNAHVELFVCTHDPLLSDAHSVDTTQTAKSRAAYQENQLRRLHALARPLADDGVAVTVDVAWDSPLHEGIVRKALASNADLVVKDTHYHTALRRSIFSNTDWNLIRECPVPLWLVKPRETRSQPCFVAAVDPVHERDKPAELDNEILSIGAELSAALGGRLEVFHAFDVVSALAVTTGAMTAPLVLPVPELIDAVKTRHADAVDALTSRHGIARERVHLEQGGTRDRLLVLTDRLGADVVIMGAVSRRGLARVFIGNTAEDVLDRLGCDLLIVKPHAVAAALRARSAA